MAQPDQRQTLFRPSQVELDETMQEVLTVLERVQPVRVVLDSLSILRDMADDLLAYRQQVLALKQALNAGGCTALVTDEWPAASDLHVRTLAHGVVRLRQEVTMFGNEQRQVEIVKMRGMSFHGGRHDLVIATGGIQVFPRLVPAAHDTDNTERAALDRRRAPGRPAGRRTRSRHRDAPGGRGWHRQVLRHHAMRGGGPPAGARRRGLSL